jgi:hypothetical protein
MSSSRATRASLGSASGTTFSTRFRSPTSQGVRDALNGVVAKVGLARLPERLAGVEVPAGDVAQYGRLLGAGR